MTARWGWLPDVDTCGMAIGRGQHCSKPGDHLDGCDWPLPKCLCGGLKSQHGTDRRGRPHCYCGAMCACTEYRPATVAGSQARHPVGKARKDDK